MSSSPPGAGAGNDVLPWLIPGAALLATVVFGVVGLGGTLGAAVTGHGWHPPSFEPAVYLQVLSGNSAAA